MARELAAVSVVCVFNDSDVLATCLERSILGARAEASDVELIAVDNRDQAYPSAGAALNHGAKLARHPVIAFAHQDVYFQSIDALRGAAADLLSRPDVGLLGAVGITQSGSVAGVVRDRVVMIGQDSDIAADVDTVDEVAFLLRRADVLNEGLSEDPALAWHAYAVEYCARMRQKGRRVVTADLAITHNSMTVNLDKLTEAHARIAELYPKQVPLQTTCGVVRAPARLSRLRALGRRRRGFATWLLESRRAADLGRITATLVGDVILADIRLDIDDLLELLGASELEVLNVEPHATSTWDLTGLQRRGRDVVARQVAPHGLRLALAGRDQRRATLVTGAIGPWLATAAEFSPDDRLVGLARDTGAWFLLAPGAARARSHWPRWRQRAAGRRRSPVEPPARVDTSSP